MRGPSKRQFDSPEIEARLPFEVEQLFPRMREIASIVYERGAATPKEIQESIDEDLSIYAIRTLLLRMERRGILRRRRSGHHTEYVYLPGVVTETVRRWALTRFIDSNFGGSTESALQEILRLAH